MQLTATFIFWFACGHLLVCNGFQFGCILNLVKRNLLSTRVLYVSHPTIGKLMPVDLKLTEFMLCETKNVLDPCLFSREFQIINMYCHEANEVPGAVSGTPVTHQ